MTKIGGAEHDGVEVGQDLCYRCRYGSRPMVLVFIRNTNGKIPDYVRHLDSQVRKHESDRLKGLVVLYGGDGHRLKQEGEKLALSASIENIPITVAKDVMTGPLNYRLSSDVDMTVVVAEDSQVVRVFEFDADLIDTKKIDHTLQTLFDSLSDAAQ